MRSSPPAACRPPRALVAALCALLAAFAAPAAAREVRVATLADGPWPGAILIRTLVQKELTELAGGELTVTFPPALQVHGAWTADSVRAQLDGLLADPSVDVIVAIDMLGSHLAGRRASLAHPVVGAAVLDADIQRLPREGRGSGRADLTYITARLDMKRDFEAFRGVVAYERVAVLASPYVLQAIPEITIEAQRQSRELGVPITIVGIGEDVQSGLEAIPEGVDAVYVAFLPHLGEPQFRAFAEGLIARGLPSYSNRGYPDVEWGLLTTVTPPVDVERYVRRIALAAHQILVGEPAGRLPVDFERGSQLVLNLDTARKLGLSPSWKVLTEAEFIGAEPADLGRRLTLIEAVEAAVAHNRTLAAGRASVAAEAHAIEKARAPLLPDLDLALGARVIDEDRARASAGQAPQYQGTGKVTATQLVYNHGAWVNLDIQRDLQRSREHELRGTELDVVHDTAVAWLDVLRARTAAAIQRSTLKLSRRNLSTAETRARLGAGRTVDIHRWEAQIANDQQAVIQAETQVEMAQMVLAQRMGAPMEAPLSPVPIQLGDPNFIIGRPAFIARLGTPRGFARFRDFMAAEALANAPELARVDAALAATERRAALARRFWIPTVAVQAELEQQLFEAGTGVDADDAISIDPSIAGMLPPNAITFATADTTNWFVGLNISVPLYEGGERYAEIREADARIVELRRQRDALAEGIEQRVRLAAQQAGISFPRIELSHEAAVAARKSRDIAVDAYERGAIDETTVLDVQNNARISEALAANALHDFLVDLMGVHRAVGAYYFLRTPDDKADFERRFVEFMDRGVDPDAPRAPPPSGLPAPSPTPAPAAPTPEAR